MGRSWKLAYPSLCLAALISVFSGWSLLAGNNEIGVLSLDVDGKLVNLTENRQVQLSPFPQLVNIKYGLLQRGQRLSDPVRIRFKLEGADKDWQQQTSGGCRMRLYVSFFDQNGNQINYVNFFAQGQSPGWTGSFATSPWQHRREKIVVPPGGCSFWVNISSAGGPEAIGAFCVGNLTVKAINSTNGITRDMLEMKFDSQGQPPNGWHRDGLILSMGKVIRIGRDQATSGLAIVDDDAAAHAQWDSPKISNISPLDLLVVEWDEMYSISTATPVTVTYKALKPGFYNFRLNKLSLMGVPTDDEASMGFEVLVPFWKTLWFWASFASLVAGAIVSGWRLRESHKLKLENARLAQQQVLEAERFRIARDIHDDIGARVTQISLLSSAAQKKPSLNPETAADFEAVSLMSRNLIGALYETVWAISPENDHVDSLATYLCQMANQMCAQAGLKCRLHIPELLHVVPVSSSIRHHLAMTVKEAIHNTVKHAEATEVQLSVQLNGQRLVIEVKDNGKGFDPSAGLRGNGLRNMKRRMITLGGHWTQVSKPGEGTCIRLELSLPENAGAEKHGNSPTKPAPQK